ncbi:hypothetical protein, partial [Thermogutta sp.]|uniref:hypothetical protein n=1 Tax=Thermogutta sp. TaxID=1962930 RepID=UPI00321FC2BA
FPLAFLIKNPLPFILAFALSWLCLIRYPFPSLPMLLGLFSLLYTLTSLIGGMNIGYRHFLPVHPLVYLVIGRGLTLWLSSRRPIWRQVVGFIMGLWYILGMVKIFPYEIAFFNELVGGPQNGYHYLIDSNLDWGQGYKALRRYLLEHSGPVPKLVYQYTYIPPEYYGIHADSFPVGTGIPPFILPFHPAAGRYIISITTLQQGWPGNDVYFWFRQMKPSTTIGFSFFVYDVHSSPLHWIAQCSVPSVPLSDSVIEYGFGQHNLRRVEFDCTSGWIYPFAGAHPGVYSFHHDLLKERRRTFPSLLPAPPEPRDPLIARHLSQTRLSVEMNRYTADYPAFVLYEQEKPPLLPNSQTVIAGRAEIGLNPGGIQVVTPVTLSGPLMFLGTSVVRDGTDLDVETWWRVTEGPITRPFSIMGHLLTPAGEVLGVSDGLAVDPVQLLPGDILVQRHRFSGVTGEAFLLRTGAYWLDTMERWPLAEQPDSDMIFVNLPDAKKCGDSLP